jgi:methionine-rich copper-binding protein CopC
MKATSANWIGQTMLREVAKTSLTILLGSLISGWAYAHPALQASNPGQNATVAAPREVRLTFSETIIPKFSGLTIKDSSGTVVETANPSVDPNDKRQLVVPVVKPLSPGAYEVEWHAVSADTHTVKGHFSFTVAQ